MILFAVLYFVCFYVQSLSSVEAQYNSGKLFMFLKLYF